MKIFGIDFWWSNTKQTQPIPFYEINKMSGHIWKFYWFKYNKFDKKIKEDLKQIS